MGVRARSPRGRHPPCVVDIDRSPLSRAPTPRGALWPAPRRRVGAVTTLARRARRVDMAVDDNSATRYRSGGCCVVLTASSIGGSQGSASTPPQWREARAGRLDGRRGWSSWARRAVYVFAEMLTTRAAGAPGCRLQTAAVLTAPGRGSCLHVWLVPLGAGRRLRSGGNYAVMPVSGRSLFVGDHGYFPIRWSCPLAVAGRRRSD